MFSRKKSKGREGKEDEFFSLLTDSDDAGGAIGGREAQNVTGYLEVIQTRQATGTGGAMGRSREMVKSGQLTRIKDNGRRKKYDVDLLVSGSGPELRVKKPTSGKIKFVLPVDFCCDDLLGMTQGDIDRLAPEMVAHFDMNESDGPMRIFSGRDTYVFSAGSVRGREDWMREMQVGLRDSLGDDVYRQKEEAARNMAPAIWGEKTRQYEQYVIISDLLEKSGFGGLGGGSADTFGRLHMQVNRGSRDNPVTKWKPYYCRVADGFLSYFGSRTGGDDSAAAIDDTGPDGRRRPKGVVPLGDRTIIHLKHDLLKKGVWAFSVTTALREHVFKASSFAACQTWLRVMLKSIGVDSQSQRVFEQTLAQAETQVLKDPGLLEQANFAALMQAPAAMAAIKKFAKAFSRKAGAVDVKSGGGGEFIGSGENCIRMYAKLAEYRNNAPAAAAYSINKRFLRDDAEFRVRFPHLERDQFQPIYTARNPDTEGKGADIAGDVVELFMDTAERLLEQWADEELMPGFRSSEEFAGLVGGARLSARIAPALPGKKVLRVNGKAHKLKKGENTIGRDKSNMICLGERDDDVSRAHCRIDVNPSHQCYIVDVGSSRGTTLNGMGVLGSSALVPGDMIRVGNTEMHFEA